MKEYVRKFLFDELWVVLQDKVNLIQVVVGPRQIGKTTMALQIFKKWTGRKLYETADLPGTPPLEWLSLTWEKARELSKEGKTLLIIDEIQKIPYWSELVKKLFDEDKREERNIKVLLLGSSSLLMQKGLSESLTGRFELHRHYQWSYIECREAFDLNLEEYLFFGGYPGSLILRDDEDRWIHYIRDSLIETVLAKDILLMTTVLKPALLRQTFYLAVSHPAQIISYQKMLGTLHDAGNTTTLAGYLNLLANAFLVLPLGKYSGTVVKQKGSSPKVIVYDNSLISAMNNLTFKETLKNLSWRGRLIENVVGARLKIIVEKQGGEIFYWRDRHEEVDFVARVGEKLFAVEVKSVKPGKAPSSLNSFIKKYPGAKGMIISDSKTEAKGNISNVNLKDFLLKSEQYL